MSLNAEKLQDIIQAAPQVERKRPWYGGKVTPTFPDMLGALRLQLWQERIASMSGENNDPPEVLEMLLHWVAAVR